MRAGLLRHRVTIQVLSATQDTLGESSKVYQDAAVVWASINPVSGKEMLAAQQVRPDVTHKITMRYRSIGPKDRIVYDNRVFNIEAIINFAEQNRMLEIMAIEKVVA